MNAVNPGRPVSIEVLHHECHPGKPVAHNYGQLSVNNGLLRGIVACYFGLLGVPGLSHFSGKARTEAHISGRFGRIGPMALIGVD